MPRLPIPGSDQGSWGDILNDYLAASHQADGSLKAGVVASGTLADGSVTKAKLSATGGTTGQVLSTDGTSLSWTTVSGGGAVADATTTAKGIVQLAGDLGGTAAAPTVPGLAAKANDNSVVHLTGNETITGTKNFTGVLQTGGQTVVATNDARLTNERTPTDGSVTVAKLSAAAAPTNGQILSYNGTTFNWVAAPTGGSDPVLGGDLSGTASNAQIAANAVDATALATNAVTTVKITDANITTAKIADANVTTAKVADGAITEPKLGVSNAPATNQVLSWNGTALAWATPATGGGGDPTVGGDLTGTASNAQIAANAVDATALATNAVTTVKVADANITGAKIADGAITEPKLGVSNAPATNQVLSWNGTALAWATPATGGGGGGGMTAVAASANMTAADNTFIVANASTSGFTITLPAASNGGHVYVKKVDSTVNAVIIVPASGQIDGGASVVANQQWEGVDLFSDGTKWYNI